MAALDSQAPSSDEIKSLQTFLRKYGRYYGPEDGVWSPDLEAALRGWQDSQGLGQSGRLDDATKHELATQASAGTKPATDDATLTYIKENYGPGMVILLSHPELGPIIRQAATDRLAMPRLSALLEQTNWWRTQNDNERRWAELNNTDPRTADQRRREVNAEIWDLGHKLGLGGVMNGGLVQQMTEDFLRFGWNDEQLNDILMNLASGLPAGQEPVGQLGGDMATIKRVGAEWLVAVSDWTARTYATQIARGELAIEDVVVVFRAQARERFSSNAAIVTAIDRGIAPSVYFRNHQEVIARQLELDPNTINFIDDPKWSRVLEVEQTDGTTRPMTNAETVAYARNQPEWSKTRNGKEQFSELTTGMLETFGGIKR